MPIVAITLVAVLERAIGSRTPVLKSVALTILPGRKAAAIVAALTLALVRPVSRRTAVGRSAQRSVAVEILVAAAGKRSAAPQARRNDPTARQNRHRLPGRRLALSGRPLLTALRERLRRLRSGDKSEVMFGVLQIILRRDRISARVSVSRELEIFLRDMMRVAAYFDVRPIRFIGSRQRIGPTPIVRRPAAHPLVLTWSHFDFPISIRLAQSLSDRFGASFLEFGASRDGSRLRVTRMG